MCLVQSPFLVYMTLTGALTKTIVATKERLEGDLPQGKQLPSHHPGISEAQRRKEREMVAKEVCVVGVDWAVYWGEEEDHVSTFKPRLH